MTPVQLYKSLSDETRLLCLLLLVNKGELCVCDLTVALDEIQPKISRHLAQLRKSDLLIDRKHKQWVFYQLNPDLPDWVGNILTITAENNQALLKPCLQRLAGSHSCC